MARKGQKFRKHSIDFKSFIVHSRISGNLSIRQACAIYNLSPENVIKWTRRHLRGEPLEMKRGKPTKNPRLTPEEKQAQKELKAENLRLRAELAFKDELIKLYQEKEELKKKKYLESQND